MVKSQITPSRTFLSRWKEQCFFVGGSRHLSDAASCHFFCLFCCYQASAVHSQQPGDHHDPDSKLMTTSPADTEEDASGHNALSTLMLLRACTHLKLWVFLNLAENSSRGWKQEAYCRPLGQGSLRQYIWFWQQVLEKLMWDELAGARPGLVSISIQWLQRGWSWCNRQPPIPRELGPTSLEGTMQKPGCCEKEQVVEPGILNWHLLQK